MTLKIFNPGSGGGGAAAEWEYFDLTTADGSSDINSLVSSGPTYDDVNNINTVVIDRDQAGALLDPADTAFWYWDLGVQAQDMFSLEWDIRFTDDADMQGSNIAVWAGLTSDVTDMNNFSYGGGANYQTNDLRGYRVRKTTKSVGGLGASTEGVHCVMNRSGGDRAGVGNIGINVFMNALDDSDWLGNANFYSVSNAALNANAGTDPLLFFLAIGVISPAVSTLETVKFQLYRSPIITQG